MITTTALVLLTITAKVQSTPSYYSQSEIKRQTCALLCSEYRSWLNGEKGITKKSNTQSVFNADWYRQKAIEVKREIDLRQDCNCPKREATK
jgi:hypothetical protein